ncbi:thymidylate synthase [Bordetella pertussis]|nr:thymidylate synthase [Bordetella pertussis]
MKQYLDLVQSILDQGAWQENRTGVRTLSLPGAALRFDLQQGFPAVTTKKLAFKSAIGEMVGFLRATRSAAQFRALGCKVWDRTPTRTSNGWPTRTARVPTTSAGLRRPMAPLAGLQAAAEQRRRPGADALARGYRQVAEVDENGAPHVLLYKAVDQLRQCLDTIRQSPGDRRILFHGWNWAQIEEMALPPCHLLYQFLPNAGTREISLCLYIRSNDVGLGTPFNLTEGAALLHLVGRLTGYKPRWFSYFIGDAHVYENHLPMLREQLAREPYPAPQLVLSDRIPDFAVTGKYEPQWLEQVEPGDFTLSGYQHHAPLTAPMAV